MSDTAEFLERFRGFAESRGWGQLSSPTGVIGQWESFVADCEGGYGDNIDGFRHDLSVRGFIEELLRSPELAEFRQMGWVRAEVEAIDGRYRALLGDQVVRPGASWWEARVPWLAGRELAEELRAWYQVEVEICD
jgi:hypothetical protein